MGNGTLQYRSKAKSRKYLRCQWIGHYSRHAGQGRASNKRTFNGCGSIISGRIEFRCIIVYVFHGGGGGGRRKMERKVQKRNERIFGNQRSLSQPPRRSHQSCSLVLCS